MKEASKHLQVHVRKGLGTDHGDAEETVHGIRLEAVWSMLLQDGTQG